MDIVEKVLDWYSTQCFIAAIGVALWSFCVFNDLGWRSALRVEQLSRFGSVDRPSADEFRRALLRQKRQLWALALFVVGVALRVLGSW
ncbi:MAG: hypothetical protein H6682_07820 [Candidatus Eisenbacteria bacterium]|nr:hypothetical protein [Candidatus Eisenbacteria bacterium]